MDTDASSLILNFSPLPELATSSLILNFNNIVSQWAFWTGLGVRNVIFFKQVQRHASRYR